MRGLFTEGVQGSGFSAPLTLNLEPCTLNPLRAKALGPPYKEVLYLTLEEHILFRAVARRLPEIEVLCDFSGARLLRGRDGGCHFTRN